MQTPAKWWRKCKRRKPGIYLARTRKHLRPARRENGYLGRSVNMDLRQKCHEGTCRHVNHKPKPWLDLDPIWLRLRLPWWLGWKWVLAPLELAAILLLLPRYNDQLNHGNPRRVPISQQYRQRAVRDGLAPLDRAHLALARLGRTVLQGLGVGLILGGLIMTVWSHR